jgi:hypothetical protein
MQSFARVLALARVGRLYIYSLILQGPGGIASLQNYELHPTSDMNIIPSASEVSMDVNEIPRASGYMAGHMLNRHRLVGSFLPLTTLPPNASLQIMRRSVCISY